ncbi:camp-dependent protein kinase regulatory subunit [Fistulina hepatica ATCC 64428]|uniref:cAMP-dependent protein kinase regulatory subunit n=1 Tax=Fistulina hepatica ATCC 64428 TaxID=1128425 RepID=A0A0D7A712_9AGAR|nr:camp-dependent protein kinase regulatory subunit [Fistulina hepatica ATCC 64428]
MSTFDTLVAELTRDVHRVQPKDALQYCSNWFQNRLEEQRGRTRDVLAQRAYAFNTDVPTEFFVDTPLGAMSTPSPFAQVPGPRPSMVPRRSIAPSTRDSPFGTLDVPGNALLSDPDRAPRPFFQVNPIPPKFYNNFPSYQALRPSDHLQPPAPSLMERRQSVSAESIAVETEAHQPLPFYPKTPDQIRRIKESIADNFTFRALDEEQTIGVINAMQEKQVAQDEVVIRQGTRGDLFYIVESGMLYVYQREEPLPSKWLSEPSSPDNVISGTQPPDHEVYGKKVNECPPGTSFGELALMYGHNRAASVVATKPSTLWSVNRITFRTIILGANHRRRSMYEQFLSSVPILSTLKVDERSKIADALYSEVYADGAAVVKEGDEGKMFFFVEEGEARVTKKQHTEDGSTRQIEVGLLKKGDYFGELALLKSGTRQATVSAVYRTDPQQPKLKVAALDVDAFTRLLGPLRELMLSRADGYTSPRPSIP